MSLTPDSLKGILNSPRAKIAEFLYSTRPVGGTTTRRVGIGTGRVEEVPNAEFVNCTAIGNARGALIGFALTSNQLEKVLSRSEVRGKQLARNFFDRMSREAGDKGRYLLVGEEWDIFLDLLAGLVVK